MMANDMYETIWAVEFEFMNKRGRNAHEGGRERERETEIRQVGRTSVSKEQHRNKP